MKFFEAQETLNSININDEGFDKKRGVLYIIVNENFINFQILDSECFSWFNLYIFSFVIDL